MTKQTYTLPQRTWMIIYYINQRPPLVSPRVPLFNSHSSDRCPNEWLVDLAGLADIGREAKGEADGVRRALEGRINVLPGRGYWEADEGRAVE